MQLIVLGMHRSGTSVLARILNLMGAYFGPEGIGTGANQENPKGFWERRDVRALNDFALQCVGHDWNRILGFETTLLDAKQRAEFESRAARLVLDMDAHRPWFVKEPRLCLTLPLWRPLLETPVCVHVVRHPVEVASSLQVRNGIPIEAGLVLWERYLRSAFDAASGLPQVLVTHRGLMADPVANARKLFDDLAAAGVNGLRMPAEHELTSFVQENLYRERSGRTDLRAHAEAPQMKLFRLIESKGLDVPGFPKPSDPGVLAAYESTLPDPKPGEATPDQERAKAVAREKALEDQLAQEKRRAAEHRSEFEKKLDLERKKLVEQKKALEGQLAQQKEQAARQRAESDQALAAARQLGSTLEANLKRHAEQARASAARIQGLEKDVVRLQGETDRQSSLLAEANSRAEAEAVTANRHRILRHRAQAVAEARLGDLAVLTRTLTQRDTELGQLAGDVEKLGSRLRESERRLAAEKALASGAARRAADEIRELNRQIQEIKSGSLWRMVSPIHRVLGKVRGWARSKPVGDVDLIRNSDLFDATWYLKQYPDVKQAGVDPAVHFFEFGRAEGRNPGPGFNTSQYLKRNPDVDEASVNPLLHFLKHGREEGRKPW